MTTIKNFDIDFLGFFIPNLQAFYDIRRETKGLYLPKFTSRCIAEGYLLSVAKKEVFCIEHEKIRFTNTKKKYSEVSLLIHSKGW